jgi:hypothetical protein
MRLIYPFFTAVLLVAPAVAQPIIIPLSPQKKDESPPPPSPVPVAPPQANPTLGPNGSEPQSTNVPEDSAATRGAPVQEPTTQEPPGARVRPPSR